MEKNINTSETGKDIKSLYDEIFHLSEQISAVKERIENEYPLVDSLSKIKIEIGEIKKKTTELEEYKSYAERISKDNGELERNGEKETQIKWPLRFSIGVGLSFFVFSDFCVWHLLSTTKCVEDKNSIPMLIVGAIIYFVMAVILVVFAYQSMQIFNRKENYNTKK